MTETEKEKFKKKVGKSIKKWRLGKGLNQTQLSSNIKVSQGSLSDIETGKQFPSFNTTFMLIKKFPATDWGDVLFD